LLPQWIEEGYNILITADHGMNTDGHHGGTGEDERDVGLIAIGDRFEPGVYTNEYVPQLMMAPLMCSLLNIPASEHMVGLSIPGYRDSI